VRTWFSAKSDTDRGRLFGVYSSDLDSSASVLRKFIKNNGINYPIDLGKESDNGEEFYLSKDAKITLALYLADKYMLHFDSTHCQPLQREHFQLPWSENRL
jgi:hypothetical protein